MKTAKWMVTGVLAAAMLTGCSDKTAPTEPAQQQNQENEAQTQETNGQEENGGEENGPEATMVNPWRDSTEEEANELIPRLFAAPDGAEVLGWSVMEDVSGENSELVELEFELDDLIFNARAQVTGDEYLDISGMYYEWEAESDVTLANWGGGNMQGTMYRATDDTGMVDLITWYDVEIGISYSLSVAAADLDGFDIQAIAEQMYVPESIGGLLRDDPVAAESEIQTAMAAYIEEVYGGDVEAYTIAVDRIYDSADVETEEFLQMIGLTEDEVPFEVSYELKPAEGLDADALMLLSMPDGEYDEASGWITEFHRVGVLSYGADGYEVDNERFGTGW